jgi:4-hydroxy-3-methylbut-2-enyl diphosphate reductase IspH
MPRVEIAPGLFVGSEMSDLRREQKEIIERLVRCENKDERQQILYELHGVSRKIERHLLPKSLTRR